MGRECVRRVPNRRMEKMKKCYSFLVKYFLYFIGASVVGWIYEVLTIMIENHHGFQNRGVMYGPYLPVYGFGMLVLLVTVNQIRRVPMEKIKQKSYLLEFLVKLLLVFLATVLVSSLVELIASYIIGPTSWVYKKDGTGNALWYYSANEGYSINFQGRIALKSSLRFGVGGSFLLYVLQPLFQWLCKKEKAFLIGGSVVLFVFLIDVFATFIL